MYSLYNNLAGMNDGRLTFNKIADTIELNLLDNRNDLFV